MKLLEIFPWRETALKVATHAITAATAVWVYRNFMLPSDWQVMRYMRSATFKNVEAAIVNGLNRQLHSTTQGSAVSRLRNDKNKKDNVASVFLSQEGRDTYIVAPVAYATSAARLVLLADTGDDIKILLKTETAQSEKIALPKGVLHAVPPKNMPKTYSQLSPEERKQAEEILLRKNLPASQAYAQLSASRDAYPYPDPDQSLGDAALRELQESTGINGISSQSLRFINMSVESDKHGAQVITGIYAHYRQGDFPASYFEGPENNKMIKIVSLNKIKSQADGSIIFDGCSGVLDKADADAVKKVIAHYTDECVKICSNGAIDSLDALKKINPYLSDDKIGTGVSAIREVKKQTQIVAKKIWSTNFDGP